MPCAAIRASLQAALLLPVDVLLSPMQCTVTNDNGLPVQFLILRLAQQDRVGLGSLVTWFQHLAVGVSRSAQVDPAAASPRRPSGSACNPSTLPLLLLGLPRSRLAAGPAAAFGVASLEE